MNVPIDRDCVGSDCERVGVAPEKVLDAVGGLEVEAVGVPTLFV